MAHLTIEYYSEALCRPVTFRMILPGDRPHPDAVKRPTRTLLLLHGYTGAAENWVPEYLTEKYNFAIVMPSGENSFWLDREATGSKFCTFVGQELIGCLRRTFSLATRREETYVMGLSMGGFGALHTGFAWPENFGKVCAMSPAMIVHDVAKMKPGDGTHLANYAYYRECFGDPEKVLESDANPETLVLRCLAEGKPLPEIHMCCGTEDFLLEGVRQTDQFLTAHGVPHIYFEAPGAHTMEFWQTHMMRMIEWMMAD